MQKVFLLCLVMPFLFAGCKSKVTRSVNTVDGDRPASILPLVNTIRNDRALCDELSSQKIQELFDANKSKTLTLEEAKKGYQKFAHNFGKSVNDGDFDARFDFNDSGRVDFEDLALIGPVVDQLINVTEKEDWKDLFYVEDNRSTLSAIAAINDYRALIKSIGIKRGEPGYIAQYDINENDIIDIEDAHELIEIITIYLKEGENSKWSAFVLIDKDRDGFLTEEEKNKVTETLFSLINTTEPDEKFYESFDVNQDGVIDHYDLTLINWAITGDFNVEIKRDAT